MGRGGADGYSPLIYAYEEQNIAITGEGILEGGGSNQSWWPWKGKWKHTPWQLDANTDQQQSRAPLFAMAEAGVAVADRVLQPNFLRPPFIQPYRCQKVLVEGVTIRNSPFWLLNPVLCTDVVVRGVNFVSHGPNSDGCDPESCNRVLIENCLFDTGDDCIALKSGRNNDGRRLATPVQNVVIQDCLMKAGHGGVVLGSEISGGAKHIYARRLRMSSPNLDRGLRIKTNSLRGGLIDTVAMWDIDIGQVKDVLVINFYYEEGDTGNFLPDVRNISLHNWRVAQAERLFELRGLPPRSHWCCEPQPNQYSTGQPGCVGTSSKVTAGQGVSEWQAVTFAFDGFSAGWGLTMQRHQRQHIFFCLQSATAGQKQGRQFTLRAELIQHG